MNTLQALVLITTLLLLSFSAGAQTFNSTKIVRTTVLTGKDAKNFQDEFGRDFNSDDFNFKCEDNRNQYTCAIVANKTILTGEVAKKLTRSRYQISVVSSDGDFRIDCEKHSTLDHTCIIQQKHSVTT